MISLCFEISQFWVSVKEAKRQRPGVFLFQKEDSFAFCRAQTLKQFFFTGIWVGKAIIATKKLQNTNDSISTQNQKRGGCIAYKKLAAFTILVFNGGWWQPSHNCWPAYPHPCWLPSQQPHNVLPSSPSSAAITLLLRAWKLTSIRWAVLCRSTKLRTIWLQTKERTIEL